MSIELVTDYGSCELIGELRIGASNSVQCISDLPFFKVPDRQRFRLRFRLFHLDVEVAEQNIEFDATPSGDELRVHGGLLWLRKGFDPPRLLSAQEIADLPDRVYRQARLLLQCSITNEGIVAPATHFHAFSRSDATVHDVAIDLQAIEEQDPVVRGVRSREQVMIVIELAKPLTLPVYNAFTVGLFDSHFSGGAFHPQLVTPEPSISEDGHFVHIRLGPLVHLSHVFISSRAGEVLRWEGIERRVLAFMYFGRRYDYDESMSQNIDRYLDQHDYQRREPLREQNGVKLGPAGQAAIGDFFNALQPAWGNGDQEASDEALFARLLQDSGIDPLNVADVVRHANAIQALQWPKVFASWQRHLKDRKEAKLPVSPLEIVEKVLQLQERHGEAQSKDALAAWQRFRKPPKHSAV
jgi:hypothetical protein